MAGGRPTIMTDEVLKKLEEAFLIGCTDTEASLYADITPRTLYNYQKENPEFLQRKEQLKERPFLKARKTIVESLGDPNHAFKFMERKKRAEFGQNVEVTGNLTISQVLDQLQNGQETTGQELED
jgi:hypothetical protein